MINYRLINIQQQLIRYTINTVNNSIERDAQEHNNNKTETKTDLTTQTGHIRGGGRTKRNGNWDSVKLSMDEAKKIWKEIMPTHTKEVEILDSEGLRNKLIELKFEGNQKHNQIWLYETTETYGMKGEALWLLLRWNAHLKQLEIIDTLPEKETTKNGRTKSWPWQEEINKMLQIIKPVDIKVVKANQEQTDQMPADTECWQWPNTP